MLSPRQQFLHFLKNGLVGFALLLSFSSHAELDSSIAVIAGPVDFNAILIDESTVELSWNAELLDGSEVSHFIVRNANNLLTQTVANSWRIGNIDRNANYDFSVSAVTINGEETRRSNRIYYDLPQLSEDAPDGFNANLPPLENLQAQIIDAKTIKLDWSPARDFWSWAEPEDYRYVVIVNGLWVDIVEGSSYTLTDFDHQGLFWIGVAARVEDQLASRQSTFVLVDTESEPGTVTKGYPGFTSVLGLRTEVYSSTAAELFWQKSGSPTTSHIYLDGRLVERLHEGTSLFLDNLEPGKRTLVSVGEGWPYDPEPPFEYLIDYDYPLMHAWIETGPGEPDNTGDPEPVTGLRYDIYGATSAEVFWDRSGVALANYRVYQNGELLTQTEGVSWHSRSLPSGTNITIGVTAIGPDGTESDVREISFNTLGDDDDEPDVDCSVTGLRVVVYGNASAEIFWDRDKAGTRYNLTLNGTFLANTDAVSWYSNSYEPASSHRIVVKNASVDCKAAEAAAVEFELTGSDNQSSTPTKPGNLRADVYSRTAAEIFWDSSLDDGWVIGYDILRDGNTVAEALDARSYFDNTLLAGENYTYTVLAIDNDGNRSEQVTVSITTVGDKSSSQINRENHVEVISDMFAIYVGDTYTDPLDSIAKFNITGRNEDFSFIDVFDCDSGSFEQELDPTSTNAGVFFTFDFNQCVFDGKAHNGYVSGQDSARGLSFTTNQFSIRDVETVYYAEYSGGIQKLRSQSVFFDRIHSFETDGVRIEYINTDSELLLEQMQTSFAYGNQTSGLDVAWLRGGFNTRLHSIDGPMMAVSTPIEFSYKLNTRTDGSYIDDIPPSTEPITKERRDNWTFTTGRLQIIAEDGGTLILEADNGNPLTASITITSDKGVEVFEQPWSLWVDVLRFDRFPDLSR